MKKGFRRDFMGFLGGSLSEAARLIGSANPDVVAAVWTSIWVSILAIAIAAALGIPSGFLIATKSFPGKGALTTLLQTLMATPTVVIGLAGYAFLTRRGPLGPFGLLFTPWAMVIGEFVLILPIVMMLSISATKSIHEGVRETALTLGATPAQAAAAVFREGRFAYLTAIAAGFGRAIGEVGIAMMLGGNIRGATRTMTTAIALETGKGDFSLALALGIILLAVAFAVNFLIRALQSRAGEAK
jgi:tungstate transport system permease protein